jgi:lysozyme
MIASPACVEFIRAFERFRARKYLDQGKRWTIGYGHLILPTESFSEVTRDEAEHLLRLDVAEAATALSVFGDDLRQYEFDALVSFVFNLGAGAFKGSTLRGRLLEKNRVGAAHEFRRWHYCGKEPSMGLLRRRIAEELMFLGGHPRSALDIAERMSWL